MDAVKNEMVYTVKEVSEILRCGKAYVYKLINTGQLKCLRLGTIKIRKSTLEEFLSKWDGYDMTDPSNPSKIQIGEIKDSNN